MVEHNEDPLFSGTCYIINNWYDTRYTFRDTTATLRAHEISKIMTQTKGEIDDEINSLLIGKGSSKMGDTVEAK